MSDSTVTSDFSSIPILDYSLLDSTSQRPKFIAQLQHALINVGFLYLSNHPVSTADIDSLIQHIPKLFALPQEAKDKIRMANSEHFLGYSRLGAELTKGKVDRREQFDFATRHVCRWKEGDPEYYRLWGPSQVCVSLSLSDVSFVHSARFSGLMNTSFRDLGIRWNVTWTRFKTSVTSLVPYLQRRSVFLQTGSHTSTTPTS